MAEPNNRGMQMKEEKTYRELFQELEKMEREGIGIRLNGFPASPQQIVEAHMLCEQVSYMRDYVIDSDGKVEELCFDELEGLSSP